MIKKLILFFVIKYILKNKDKNNILHIKVNPNIIKEK